MHVQSLCATVLATMMLGAHTFSKINDLHIEMHLFPRLFINIVSILLRYIPPIQAI